MSVSAQDLGRRIVEINRAFRLGATTPEEWTDRIVNMLRAQPDISEPIAVRDVRPLKGAAGSSSGTLFFEASHVANGSVVEGSYVLRFTPTEQLFRVYDLDGQIRIQRALAETDVPVPRQCWEDTKGRYLGVPGYVMARAPGAAAPQAWFAEGVIAEAEPPVRRRMMTSYLATLAKIHAVDWRRRGLSFLLERAEGEGLIGREINWYWEAMDWAGEREAMLRFEQVRVWLASHQPAISSPCLCHGDTNFTNNLFDGDAVSGVLDWEMAFIGAPEADLAYALLAISALEATLPDGIPSAAEMTSEYERLSGRKIENLTYYKLFALFRVVLILNLGKRAFPPEFQAPFSAYIESTVDRMNEQSRSLGAPVA